MFDFFCKMLLTSASRRTEPGTNRISGGSLTAVISTGSVNTLSSWIYIPQGEQNDHDDDHRSIHGSKFPSQVDVPIVVVIIVIKRTQEDKNKDQHDKFKKRKFADRGISEAG